MKAGTLRKFRIKVTAEGCFRVTVWFAPAGNSWQEDRATSYWPTLAKALEFVQGQFEVES